MPSSFRVLIYGVLLVGMTSCKKQLSVHEKLQGHWHVSDENYNVSLDIEDSVVIFNKYSLVSFAPPEKFDLYDSTKAPVLPFYCGCGSSILPVVNEFQIKGDSLICTDETLDFCYAYTPLKFVRGDLKTCKRDHAFVGYLEYLELVHFPVRKKAANTLNEIAQQYFTASLLIAYAVDSTQFGSKPKILAGDAFIEMAEVKRYIDERVQTAQEPVNVALIIDQRVPRSFLNEVMDEIHKTNFNEIYHLVEYDDGSKLGYELIEGKPIASTR